MKTIKPIKKSTIREVAHAAGVSIATVSFVLNDTPGQVISETVRLRVLEAARVLNYHPSASAAGLARKRTGNLAVIFYRCNDLVSNQYYSFVVQGAIREAMAQEYNLLFAYVEEEYGQSSVLPKVVRENNTEGVVFIQRISPSMIRDIHARGIPVVAVDCFPHSDQVNIVKVDDVCGGQLAVEHLLSLHHRRIAFVYARDDIPSIADRLAGYQSAMKTAGMSRNDRLVPCDELSFEASERGLRRLFARRNPPGALICANDEMAAGALRAAHAAGLSVPRDISIMGFDNITMGNYTDPSLTTVGPDKEALGSRAVRRLIEMIRGEQESFIKELLPVQLIQRQSTGPVPQRG